MTILCRACYTDIILVHLQNTSNRRVSKLVTHQKGIQSMEKSTLIPDSISIENQDTPKSEVLTEVKEPVYQIYDRVFKRELPVIAESDTE